MKRLIVLACAVILSVGASAQAIREIRDVNTVVKLEQDGSAWVTQT